ncbi:GAT domain-containing protein [Actibacterium sp. XHP0104]|uniref:GAT domain-containing protein n=1 Tax=Actibacterium sp. XHP0104 TaxID=2984335 RepID=UPI0021E74238|nr:GAT domain-containing protein [Actibacterium sp. XHP0104]MCV2880750.1 GAT domain-containing protein [Actibacterium sp. XHP0104]
MQLDSVGKPISERPWYGKLDAMGLERGSFERLGDSHAALFIDETPTLLVSFETADSIGDADGAMPLAYDLAEDAGWSLLSVLCDGDTWFRDRRVFGYFDRLVDDGFFEDFDRVVFYGSGMCGYAATAFSVAAPGATVIAICPQATLDPRVTEWDPRFAQFRRLSFTDRYGYAPDMLEAAERAFILYDPDVSLDSVHAALFTRPNVTKLRCRWLNGTVEADLIKMGVLSEMLDAACEGHLTEEVFHQLYRARRDYKPYLRRLMETLEDEERPYLTALLCQSVAERLRAPLFRKRFRIAVTKLAQAGEVPGWINPEAMADQ